MYEMLILFITIMKDIFLHTNNTFGVLFEMIPLDLTTGE